MSKPISPICVYCIINIHTLRRYVGSTQSLTSRKRQHLYSLRKGNHYSQLMQKDYNEHGEHSFEFVKIESVFTEDRDELYKREQFWINEYHPEYNKSLIAGDVFPAHVHTKEFRDNHKPSGLGRIQSQEEKDKRAESIKRFWATHPPKTIPQEMRKHLSKINTGEGNPNYGLKRSAKWKSMVSNVCSTVEYTFKSPKGKLFTFTNLEHAPILKWVPYGTLRNLYKGKTVEYKGWTFVESRRLR